MQTPYVLRLTFHAVQLLRRAATACLAVARRFYADECLTRASGLAYTSLLSIVPLFALMFAVLKGLGVQRRLEPLLLSRLSLQPDTTAAMIDYIDRTNVGTLGALGAAALVLTVISVLGSIEASFNHIWRVEEGRSIWRKVTDYLGVVLLTPFLLLAAVAITSSLQAQRLLDWVLQQQYLGEAALHALQLVPVLFNVLALGVLYAVMPNRRQSPGAVLVGALVAGAAWHVLQLAYVHLQIGMARYNAIYGALSQVPVTLVWLYVSWTVVLAGAELAAAVEFGVVREPGTAQRVDPVAVALHTLVRAAHAFASGAGRVDVGRVAGELGVGRDAVAAAARWMTDRGWLVRLDAQGHYILGRDAAAIDLGDLAALASSGAVPGPCDARVRVACDMMAGAAADAWARLRLADVLAVDAAAAPVSSEPTSGASAVRADDAKKIA